MRRPLAWIALAALILAGLALWSWSRSDERRIVRALERLERACEKQGPDGPLALFQRTQTILDGFAPGFQVLARPYAGSISDARQLAGVIHRYRALSQRVRIGHSDLDIVLRENRTAEMTAVFQADGDRGAGPGRERFRARLFWVEHAGEWKIREFDILEVLDRSGRVL
jgi:hypothetical protein